MTAVDPDHYKFPGGAEVIDLTRHLPFCEGNVVKYVARAGRKTENRVEDLLKAQQYLQWAIENASGDHDWVGTPGGSPLPEAAKAKIFVPSEKEVN